MWIRKCVRGQPAMAPVMPSRNVAKHPRSSSTSDSAPNLVVDCIWSSDRFAVWFWLQIRGSSQPDRTVYTITDPGRETALEWLREMLVETRGEYPEFIAAVSLLFVLPPDEARRLLEERAERLVVDLAQAADELAANPGLPRLFLLEEEYRRAVLQAELAWIRAVSNDIDGGRLGWDDDWIREMGVKFNPPIDEP